MLVSKLSKGKDCEGSVRQSQRHSYYKLPSPFGEGAVEGGGRWITKVTSKYMLHKYA